LAWILAPIDFGMTWVSWYKKAEEARRRQNKIELNTKDLRNEEVHIY
jgi:hypothetical protein